MDHECSFLQIEIPRAGLFIGLRQTRDFSRLCASLFRFPSCQAFVAPQKPDCERKVKKYNSVLRFGTGRHMLKKPRSSTINGRISRRNLFQAAASGAAGTLLPTAFSSARVAAAAPAEFALKDFEFEEANISDLQDHMKSGRLTAHALAAAYLDRIQYVDASGPALNSVIEVNPDALGIAESLDRERKEKGPR